MRLFFALLTVLYTFLSQPALAENTPKRVAVLISSYGTPERENLSYDLEELAQAYLVLYSNGVDLDIISPKGGAVLVHNKKDDLPYIQAFKTQTPALQQLNATLASGDISATDYDGMLIIGGSGAMFDLPVHPATTNLISNIAKAGKPLAAVCHGPAALLNVKKEDGAFLVAGRKVNSFTNIEEHAFSSDIIESLPFLLEDALKERGATFVHNAPMLPYVAVDGTLITAQNPSAVASAAEALLVQLGVTPKERAFFKDEATMKLIQKARTSGAFLIDVALKKAPDLYDINYLALYGFYSYRLAEGDTAKKQELEIMQTVGRHFEHPMYSAALIQALMEQGYEGEAREQFIAAQTRHPDNEAIKSLAVHFSD